jgi:hypothetical protein
VENYINLTYWQHFAALEEDDEEAVVEESPSSKFLREFPFPNCALGLPGLVVVDFFFIGSLISLDIVTKVSSTFTEFFADVSKKGTSKCFAVAYYLDSTYLVQPLLHRIPSFWFLNHICFQLEVC